MRRLRTMIASLAGVVLLAACNQPAPTGQPEPTSAPTAPASTAPTAQGAYPAPGDTSAYPGPDASSAYPGPAPTPDLGPTISSEPVVVPQPASASVGVATGKVLRIAEGGTREPVAGYYIYLGRILQNNLGDESIVELDKATAPKARLNAFGEFVFVDVPPGRYGLMLELLRGAVLLNDPDSGGNMIVEIKGGDVVDLGEMAYPLPAE